MSIEEDLNAKVIELNKIVDNMKTDYTNDLSKGIIKPALLTASELVAVASSLMQRARSLINGG
jgi:uncharacterized protein YeeX (DUF496 family)